MNRLQRWAVRSVCRFVPQLGKLFESAGNSVESLAYEVEALRERNDYQIIQRDRMKAELQEAIALAGGGPWRGGADVSPAPVGVRESQPGAVVALRERLWELELALEDQGWQRQLAYASTEFSRYGIQQLILICRLYFLKNPLIRQGVQVSANYVFGRGLEISSPDEATNEVLQRFLSDPRNVKEIGQRALVEKEEALNTDGNLFFALFTDVKTGEVVIRTIDATEISEVVCDPEDAGTPWFYRRNWTYQGFSVGQGLTAPTTKETCYVDIDYDPPAGLTEINRSPIAKGADGDFIRVLHFKVGGLSKWHFGCPLVYAAIDWARAYKAFLEDWASITRALARFSWNVETKGGAGAIASFKQTLATTLANDGDSIERNPGPVAASAFVTGPGNKLTPIKTSGATTEPEQGRRVALMVFAALGLPETFFGDASVGTVATAQSLDRPTELKFLGAQERWREVLQRICRFVLERSATAPAGRLMEARKKDPAPQPAAIDVKFPAMLEHQIEARIGAVVNAMTLGAPGGEIRGIDEKTGVGLLLSELGVQDVQVVLDAMYPEGDYSVKRKPREEDPDVSSDPNKISKAVEALLAARK